MCQMRLPQGRVLLQSTFEGVPQLQIELMISCWKIIVSSYHWIHQVSHLANQARRKLDFPKVTSEVHQFSRGNCIFDISLKP